MSRTFSIHPTKDEVKAIVQVLLCLNIVSGLKTFLGLVNYNIIVKSIHHIKPTHYIHFYTRIGKLMTICNAPSFEVGAVIVHCTVDGLEQSIVFTSRT